MFLNHRANPIGGITPFAVDYMYHLLAELI